MIALYEIIVLGVSSIVTAIMTLLTIFIEKRRDILCIDIHKPNRPRVPCIGAPGILLGTAVGLLLSIQYLGIKLVMGVALSLAAAFAIGLADDIYNISAYKKILLGLVPALPIVLLNLYTPRPWIPFLGYARLTILYPLLILAAFTVFINGANMIDTHNGVLVFAALTSHIFALLVKMFSKGSIQEILLLALFTIVLATYLVFNAYPAKILNGNAGSFLVGSIIAISAIITRLEMYFILANIAMFINGFYYISSVRGFIQKERVERPVEIDIRGCMRAKSSHKAPITLVRLILLISRDSLSEEELVTVLSIVYVITLMLAAIIVLVLGYG